MTRVAWGVGIAVWLAAGATAFAGSRMITVTGTIDDPEAAVMVNGAAATVSNGSYSAPITLTSEGENTITVTATDKAGNDSTTSVTVSLDTVPPVLVISSPSSGQLFGAK